MNVIKLSLTIGGIIGLSTGAIAQFGSDARDAMWSHSTAARPGARTGPSSNSGARAAGGTGATAGSGVTARSLRGETKPTRPRVPSPSSDHVNTRP